MDLVDQLAALLKEDLLEPAEEGGSVSLREKKAKMQVEIVGAPRRKAVVRIERTGHLPGLRDGPWKRICDYLLIFEIENDVHAVFVELKKTSTNEQRPKEQLRRSLPILEYLRTACRIEHGSALKEPPVTVSYLMICERGGMRLDKQPVRSDPAARMYEETYENITIGTFIGTSVPLRASPGIGAQMSILQWVSAAEGDGPASVGPFENPT